MGIKMNSWKSLLINIFQQQDIVIDEQRVKAFNPIYNLANVTTR
jgi:hypothetical protein